MENKLLVIVDMQNDFIDGVLGTTEAQCIVDDMVEYIKNWDGAVVATLDTHNENYKDTIEGQKLPVEHCIKGTKGWKLNSKIYEALFNTKSYYLKMKAHGTFEKDTFGSMELAEYIKENDFEEIQFAGVCTGICVISNVMLAKAVKPNTPIKVIEDLCACVTPASHKTAIEAMKMCHIDIIKSNGFKEIARAKHYVKGE